MGSASAGFQLWSRHSEQVEHIEDLDVLRELGIDYAQGFAIHTPEPWPLADY